MREAMVLLPLRRRIAAVLLALLTLLCVLFIWGNSLEDPSRSLDSSARFEAIVRPIVQKLRVSAWQTPMAITTITRKLAHFAEFFMLGALLAGLAWCLWPVWQLRFALLLGLCVAVAISDEMLQFLNRRGPGLMDVVIDAAGGITGLAVVTLLRRATGMKGKLHA